MGLAMSDAILCVVLYWLGFAAGALFIVMKRQAAATPRIDSRWQSLPSGWSRNVGGLTIYAMTQDGNAYWWVARNGRTIIEGPSSTIDMAKIEAEREAHELSR